MNRLIGGIIFVGLLGLGCGDKKEASGEPSGATNASSEGSAEAKGGAELGGQIKAWCAAQTKGDFVEYSSFYATNFEGIKRGRRGKEKKFDNKAWMKDRKRMFKMPLQVDCKALQVGEAKDGVTSVNFEQYWQSPSYADEGPKRVDFKRVDDNLVIVGEEMISSTKWDRKKFKDGTAPPKRAFKTYEEIGDHSFGDMVSKKGHREYRKCHFVKPKNWGKSGDEENWPADCAQYISSSYGTFE